MILVNILTGSSVEHTLRASISPKVRRHPPIRPLRSIVDKRLFLSSILAPCGASREIKLISPVMLITLEVARVAIKRTSIRIWLTFTPSILPSASSRESIKICLYNRNIISRQTAHSITFEPMEYMLMPLRLPMIQYSIDANCFSGSAVSFRHTRAVWARLCTAMPASTMLFPSRSYVSDDRIRTSSHTAYGSGKSRYGYRHCSGQKQNAKCGTCACT